MNVLFISSGNSKTGINPIVKNQGESLKSAGINVEYYTIKGKGLISYLNHIIPLKKYISKNQFDLYHAHYFLSGIVAVLASVFPLIISFMGSDLYISKIWLFIIRLLYLKKNIYLVVKSEILNENLNLKNVYVIPNGVDVKKFYPIEKSVAKKKNNWKSQRYILFASDPKRREKNYKLAEQAIKLLNMGNYELVVLKNIPNKLIPYYLNGADLLLLTSIYEGSPNIIKEAMACNCPIVTSDVGDVSWVMGKTKGCFLTSFDPIDVVEKIKLALEFSNKTGRTNGRDRILELGLDSESIAKRMTRLYRDVIEESK